MRALSRQVSTAEGGVQGPEPAPAPPPLAWAHMLHRKTKPIDHGVEAFKAVSHGYWSSRFVAVVSGPAAEPRNRPGRPCKTLWLKRILLLFGAPLHCLLKRMENPDLLVVEHAIGQRPLAASFPHEHELHRDSRRDESDYGQFFESFAVLDDTFLDAQPLAF